MSSARAPKDAAVLTIEERRAIDSNSWFSSLSPSLRHDILRVAYVKRYRDGQVIGTRGAAPEEWKACAKGAVRVCSTSVSGKQTTLAYVEPGFWFGDTSLLDGGERTHDAYAHGDCTLLCVRRADFERLLAEHTELYAAILQLHVKRIRMLYATVEDMNTLALRSRLAKQLLVLMRGYGEPASAFSKDIRIGLHLAQEELGQLLGASRQRVNQALKAMERRGIIRVDPAGLVICDLDGLQREAQSTAED